MHETLEELKQQKREIEKKIRSIEKEISETVVGNFRLKHQRGEYLFNRDKWFWSVSFKTKTQTDGEKWIRLFMCETKEEARSKVEMLANEALNFSKSLQDNV